MPAKGYRKPTKRDDQITLRLTKDEKAHLKRVGGKRLANYLLELTGYRKK